MGEETLNPAPRGWWERILARSFGVLVFVATLTWDLLRDDFGLWGAATMSFGAFGLGALLLVRMAAPERRERLARDAERGILECSIRYPDAHPGSIRHRWLPGFAQVSRGAMKFQPDLTGGGSPSGTIRSFSDVVLKGPVEPPVKRPSELKRGWRIAALGTDEGLLHVATGDTGLKLIEERLGDQKA